MTDATQFAAADAVLHAALEAMKDREIPLDVAADRLVCLAARMHVAMVGSGLTGRCFREYAAKIEAGLFAASEPQRGPRN